ncbi:GAF domain-containing protein [Nocardioides sp. MAHUQ-72]|uniref:GAF domain-containing protein n=1 Tax=unclassified Nocardioides TaxID=2615069 RepID=UPI0036147AB5
MRNGPTTSEVRALESARTLEDVGAVVRTAARRIAHADGATFVLREDDRCFYADEDAIAPLWKGQRFPMSECISGWAMTNGLPAVVPDIDVSARIPREAYRPTFVRSLVMVPIGNPAVGAIGAYWQEVDVPTDHEVEGLQRLAAVAAGAFAGIGISGAPWAPNFRSDDNPLVH